MNSVNKKPERTMIIFKGIFKGICLYEIKQNTKHYNMLVR